jgi:phage gp36-like protein
MNKQRISELAKQAGPTTIGEINTNLGSVHVINIEKFAELIVRECCEVAHCNFHVDGLTLGSILKEHFGVEE